VASPDEEKIELTHTTTEEEDGTLQRKYHKYEYKLLEPL